MAMNPAPLKMASMKLEEEIPALLEEIPAPLEEIPAPLSAIPAPFEETSAPLEERPAFLEEIPGSVEEILAPLEEIPAPCEESGSTNSAWDSGRILEQIQVEAPPVAEDVDAQDQPSGRQPLQESRPQDRYPDARKPNYEAFRKFGVDEFEVPTGDDFEGITEVSPHFTRVIKPLIPMVTR